MTQIFGLVELVFSILEKVLAAADAVILFVNENSRVLEKFQGFLKEVLTVIVKALVYFAPVFIFVDNLFFPLRARILIFFDQVASLIEEEVGDSLPGFKFTERSVVSITSSLGLKGLHLGGNYVFKIPRYLEVGEDVIRKAPEGFVDLIEVRGDYLVLRVPSSMDQKEHTNMVFHVIDSIE